MHSPMHAHLHACTHQCMHTCTHALTNAYAHICTLNSLWRTIIEEKERPSSPPPPPPASAAAPAPPQAAAPADGPKLPPSVADIRAKIAAALAGHKAAAAASAPAAAPPAATATTATPANVCALFLSSCAWYICSHLRGVCLTDCYIFRVTALFSLSLSFTRCLFCCRSNTRGTNYVFLSCVRGIRLCCFFLPQY